MGDDNRQWMYWRYHDRAAFERGLEGFLQYAVNQKAYTSGDKIRCPCKKKCKNQAYLSVDEVREHVTKRGFIPNYTTWVYHGEVEQHTTTEATRMDVDDQSSNNYQGMVLEHARPSYFEHCPTDFEEPPNRAAQQFLLDKARRRYISMMSEEKKTWKKDKGKNPPKYMHEDFWKELKEYWVREDVKKISKQNSQNRLCGPDGPGKGISKHCGGSRSTRRLVQKMSRKTGLPHRVLNYESFRRNHIKADGTYLTKRDEKLDVEIHEIARRDGREDLNEIFLEITRPIESRRYGTGSFGSSQLLGGGSTQSTASSTAELTQSMFQARIGTLEKQLAQEKEARAQQAEEDREAHARLEQQAEEERQARQRLEAQFAEFRNMLASCQFPTPPPPPPP